MRHPAVIIVLLLLFALVPIGAWVAMAASLDPSGLGRNIGKAILVLLSPPAFAGLLMILGAAMFNRTRRAGRIFAAVGAAIAGACALILAGLWLDRAGRCIEASSYCTDRLVEGGSLLSYADRTYRPDRADLARAARRIALGGLTRGKSAISNRCTKFAPRCGIFQSLRCAAQQKFPRASHYGHQA